MNDSRVNSDDILFRLQLKVVANDLGSLTFDSISEWPEALVNRNRDG